MVVWNVRLDSSKNKTKTGVNCSQEEPESTGQAWRVPEIHWIQETGREKEREGGWEEWSEYLLEEQRALTAPCSSCWTLNPLRMSERHAPNFPDSYEPVSSPWSHRRKTFQRHGQPEEAESQEFRLRFNRKGAYPTHPSYGIRSPLVWTDQQAKEMKCFFSPERISLYCRKQVKQTPEAHCHEAAFLTLFTWKPNGSPTAKLVGKVMLVGQERQPASSPAQ